QVERLLVLGLRCLVTHGTHRSAPHRAPPRVSPSEGCDSREGAGVWFDGARATDPSDDVLARGPGSPTGRGVRLKPDPVWVRIPPGAPLVTRPSVARLAHGRRRAPPGPSRTRKRAETRTTHPAPSVPSRGAPGRPP